MANVISFSLFGYSTDRPDGCFDFNSYFRYLSLNLRMKELVYPDWIVNIVLDEDTYHSHLKHFFDYHEKSGRLRFQVVKKQELCKMMLYRMSPAFMDWCDRFICRDLDSLFSYREAQAVKYWMDSGRVCSAITDSISHTIPLMGGMIGFQSKELRERLNVDSFEGMLSYATEIDYNNKGADQTFLNKVVLPRVADSMVENYVLGMPNSFRDQCFNYIHDVPLNIPIELKESNQLINHIGQSGYAIDPVLLFFEKYFTEEQKEYFNKIEKEYKTIFYWQN